MNSLKGMSDKSDKKDEKKSGVTDMGAWAMNIISSVGIIMANKQVMSRSGYNYRFGKEGAYGRTSVALLLVKTTTCAYRNVVCVNFREYIA